MHGIAAVTAAERMEHGHEEWGRDLAIQHLAIRAWLQEFTPKLLLEASVAKVI